MFTNPLIEVALHEVVLPPRTAAFGSFCFSVFPMHQPTYR